MAAVLLQSALTGSAAEVDPKVLDACPGYRATKIKTRLNGMSAELVLGAEPCNVFGDDIPKLNLDVTYETKDRIHVKITDPADGRYEIPESVFPRPGASPTTNSITSSIKFDYTASPFSFSIYRTSTREVLFSTKDHPIIFEPQFLRVKTSLPNNANIYGLGEHTNPFRLPTENTTLTMWSRDAYGIPSYTNIYGNHPVYFEHRSTGSHGVFLLNSNGMDIKLRNGEPGGPSLEYNVIGGVLDFYFLAGSTSDPTELARQYAQVAGLPTEQPYWSFGFHQCRFGYYDYVDVAGVISKYAAANIPLETMWTDIDYMDRRRVFTVDPEYFPMNRMREIVKYLHDRDQHYIVMTDPAVAYTPNENYEAYHKGVEMDIWLKAANGSDSLGVVWPGVSVYPDWFHPRIAEYWNQEFKEFYSPEAGLDIDGVWIDMNEPANFCDLPCDDPFQQAIDQQMPPPRRRPPPASDVPIFTAESGQLARRAERDILNPPYAINNAAPTGALSSKTAAVDAKHYNGLVEYDVHNLYGSMMSLATYDAMLARRPGRRPFIITRSTFAGAGTKVGKWLGDNVSNWEQYRFSIAGMLAFASIYQVPMVGSDVCGFAGDTNENLCARWATLGAFNPFMRNHNGEGHVSQEFYEWPSVTEAARHAIDIRYRLLDYMYTAFHQASRDGSPVLHPLWFKYPKDTKTYGIEHQFFYGDAILVSPVTGDDATSVDVYFPKDTFYDFHTLAPLKGNAAAVTFGNVSFTEIPLHIKGGSVVPLREKGAMTTKELRNTDFEFVVAPNAKGEANGRLYIDDGDSLVQQKTTDVRMTYRAGTLTVSGKFGYDAGVKVARVKVLGFERKPRNVLVDLRAAKEGDGWKWDDKNKVVQVEVQREMKRGFIVSVL
ncbi:alpha-glucosidase [Panaeolus papilionaceus]|nr:alpha-glucosidase [Panaeolus papilionaceus]